jgi:plasmid stabilization system protein ParE
LDLLQIQLYIGRADRSPEGAERLLRAIDAKCKLFATQPHMGTPRPDLGENLRIFPCGTKANPREWVVVVRPIENGIEVVRVFRGGQEFARLF